MESGVNVAFNVLWGELIDAINEGNREDLTRLCIMLAIGSIVLGGAVFMESFCSVLAGARLVLRIQNFTFQVCGEEFEWRDFFFSMLMCCVVGCTELDGARAGLL